MANKTPHMQACTKRPPLYVSVDITGRVIEPFVAWEIRLACGETNRTEHKEEPRERDRGKLTQFVGFRSDNALLSFACWLQLASGAFGGVSSSAGFFVEAVMESIPTNLVMVDENSIMF